MTGWNYFLTLQSILEDCPAQCNLPVTAADGCALRWDPDADRLVAWGTPFWWTPHDLIKNMVVITQPYLRTQLARSVVGNSVEYGLHLEVKSTIVSDIPPDAELALSRVLCVWQDHITRTPCRPPIIDLCGTVFRPGRRACTVRLSDQQQGALDWMVDNEARAGHPRQIGVDIAINDSHVYSFKHNLFVNSDRAHHQHVHITAGALTGHRGAGKTLIAKHLLEVPVPGTTMFPDYTYEASLVVVPTHLVKYWAGHIVNSVVVDTDAGAASWVREVPPRPVIVTYEVLAKLVRRTHELYGNFVTASIAKRNKNHHVAIDTVEWSRVIFDELGVFSNSSLLHDLVAKFKWVFQANISTLEELTLVRSLYSSATSSVDLVQAVIYNNLSRVTPMQFIVPNTIKVVLDEDEARLTVAGSVYSKSNVFTPRTCDKWTNLSLLLDDEDEDEDEEEEEEEEVTFHGPEWMAPDSMLGPSLINDFAELSRLMLGEDVFDHVGEEEEVPVSDAFFTEQVRSADETATDCAVCLDTKCDTMFRCGHMMCYVCVCSVMAADVPRCPHCRYRIDEVFTNRDMKVPTLYMALLDLLRTLPLHETIVLGCDSEGVAHVRQFIHQHLPAVRIMHINETSGRVESDVHSVVFLDPRVPTPATFSHPSQIIHRHMFETASHESVK